MLIKVKEIDNIKYVLIFVSDGFLDFIFDFMLVNFFYGKFWKVD